MTEVLEISRRHVFIAAFGGGAIKMKTSDGKTYRIDPHDALERMLNGYDSYELTTVTVEFTGEIDFDDPEISARLERFQNV